MAKVINNVNLDAINLTFETMKTDVSTRKIKQALSGEWNLNDPRKPQFRGILKSEKGGEVLVYADQPISQGGNGLSPGPIAYCLFGILSCFTATLANLAALKGIKLNKLEAVISADINLSKVFGLADEPIVESVVIETKIESDSNNETIQELVKEAEERCPAAYTLKHGTKLTVKVT